MGVGFNLAQKIMVELLKNVLMQETIGSATNSYIDDILVNETFVHVETVRHHIKKYGLISTPSESIDRGASLELQKDKKHWRVVVLKR